MNNKMDDNNSKAYIIETQCDSNINFQSRIIECSSWYDYVQTYKQYNPVKPSDYYKSTLLGFTLPKMAKIVDLKFNDYQLSCNIILYDTTKRQRFAQLIGPEFKFE